MITDYVRETLLLAVNHSGDSASCGMVCGNIVGAFYGERSVSPVLVKFLELREVIETLAGDAVTEFGPDPPDDPSCRQRYPAW